MTAGPSCANADPDGAFELARILDTNTVDADRLRHLREIGIIEPRARGQKARGFHLDIHESEQTIVEDDDLHRELELP